jgi:hypothetical protein
MYTMLSTSFDTLKPLMQRTNYVICINSEKLRCSQHGGAKIEMGKNWALVKAKML